MVSTTTHLAFIVTIINNISSSHHHRFIYSLSKKLILTALLTIFTNEQKLITGKYNCIKSTLVWKRLYTPNTCLFITPTSQKFDVTCEVIRHDVTLNNSGNIHTSQECVTKTNQNILSHKRADAVVVLASFMKAIRPIINKPLTVPHSKEIAMEIVLTKADDLRSILEDETDIQQQF